MFDYADLCILGHASGRGVSTTMYAWASQASEVNQGLLTSNCQLELSNLCEQYVINSAKRYKRVNEMS